VSVEPQVVRNQNFAWAFVVVEALVREQAQLALV